MCAVVSKPGRNGKKRENVVQWNPSAAATVGFRNQKSSTHQIKECEKRQKGKSGYGGSHRKNDHKVSIYYLISFNFFVFKTFSFILDD